jgi:hypothetical protein
MSAAQQSIVSEYTRAEIERRNRTTTANHTANGVLHAILNALEDDDQVAVATFGDGSEGVFRLSHGRVTVYRWADDTELETRHLGRLKDAVLIEGSTVVLNAGVQIPPIMPVVKLELTHERLPGGAATFELGGWADENARVALRDALVAAVEAETN